MLSVVYPVSLFVYAALASPRPPKTYWRVILVYASIVLCLKFLFQLSFLCVCFSDDGESYSIYPSCVSDTCNVPQVPSTSASCWLLLICLHQTQNELLGLTHVIGIYKVSGFFLKGSLWDVVLILAVLWHRHQMKMKVSQESWQLS